ncbi:MAG: hypothetical protein N5P05_002380 [Chroococcopsis gigantea SAG 12.99]|jgi:ABC-type molybdate transport system substrate-binding protein|nr:substrate-binding domain-containing protein [Chlorogloea purpurea SAG 13.99]MDV3000774.1 hypothetical protein [Chroococcopsis gigantea SAG 12.99]
MPNTNNKNTLVSSLITLASLGFAYIPIPGLETKIVVVSGTELTEPLKQIETQFEKKYPDIKVEIKEQGSRDIVNNIVDQKNDFQPTIVIPADGELLNELKIRLKNQNGEEAFYNAPQAIAKTLLVGIAWPERGNILFPDGRFRWQRLESAIKAGNWGRIGGQKDWGSFDFLMTDPTRSHSGQLTLALWSQSTGGDLTSPALTDLFKILKKSVYQPPRSTDILLQEFIARGPNDVDVATVYESVALYRQQQSGANQKAPYRVYYIEPTVETTATAAIVRQNVSDGQAKAAGDFINFLRQKEQQEVFIKYGFRPVIAGIKIESVTHNPWSGNIQGIEVTPSVTIGSPPDSATLGEIQRLWERSQ